VTRGLPWGMRAGRELPVLLVALAGLVAGWKVFWFLCDDAFIAFRYVSNSVLGFGYVWNASPFLPVEGYTSFLWVALLDGVWRVTGIQPPEAANVLSLGFTVGTLLLTTRMVLAIRGPAGWDRARPWLLAAVLLGCVTNRTFLTWASSGLETALFNFLLLLWVSWVIAGSASSGTRHQAGLLLVSALVYLTRPDGLLYLAASLALVGHWWVRGPRSPRRLLALSPLAIVAGHLLWRHATYGDWVPNTYRAKHVAAWPEAGSRYLASFLLEYAVWIWVLVAAGFLVAGARRFRPRALWLRPQPYVAGGALVAHAGYYTWIIGGDHFEYRVYSHLVPLLLVSAVWMAARWEWRPRRTLGLLAALVVLSWPLPWLHWDLTRDLDTREETMAMFVPVSPEVPRFLRWYTRPFDTTQAWLIDHSICRRHQEHKVYHLNNSRWLPPREEGLRLPREGHPVTVAGGVGHLAWILPYVAVIDTKGLNDFVVARTPVPAGAKRKMAHDRNPPPGYVESFRPNVTRVGDHPPRLMVVPRDPPLTADDIRERERYWREWVARHGDAR